MIIILPFDQGIYRLLKLNQIVENVDIGSDLLKDGLNVFLLVATIVIGG